MWIVFAVGVVVMTFVSMIIMTFVSVIVMMFVSVIVMMFVSVIVMMFVSMIVSMIVMTFVSVIVMIIITVIMLLKKRAIAGLEFDRAGRLHQFGCIRIGSKGCNPVFKPRGQTGTDPEHQIRVLQRLRFGRAKAVFMGASALLHNQGRFADTVHHTRSQ
jgi:hypothetical protein